jgi:hypothetical protein
MMKQMFMAKLESETFRRVLVPAKNIDQAKLLMENTLLDYYYLGVKGFTIEPYDYDEDIMGIVGKTEKQIKAGSKHINR